MTDNTNSPLTYQNKWDLACIIRESGSRRSFCESETYVGQVQNFVIPRH